MPSTNSTDESEIQMLISYQPFQSTKDETVNSRRSKGLLENDNAKKC